MYPEMYHEQVVYTNPFLAMRIWQIDTASLHLPDEAWLKQQQDRWQRSSNWHYHKEVELLLILKGELTAFCMEEQFVLRKGDVAIFGSSEPHCTIQTNVGQLSYIVVQIDLRKYWDQSTLNNMKYFAETIRPLSAMNYVYRDDRGARNATAALIRDIYREMNDARIGYELAVSSRIKDMLLLLLRNDTRGHLSYNDNQLADRLQPAVDYVEANLGGRLSVAELSALLNISYTHFVKTFKKAYGMSFTEFVIFKRIKKAEQQLLTGDKSIAEVAESVGISNLGHFYELFRRYNDCSPKQFKDRLRGPALAEAR